MNALSHRHSGHWHRHFRLPHLRSALDPDCLCQLLNAHWPWVAARGLTVTACHVHRVFPRGAGHQVIKYVLTLDDGQTRREQVAFGELLPGDVRGYRTRVLDKLRKSRRQQLARGVDCDAIVALPPLGMLLRLPGWDEKLPGLTLHHYPRRAWRLLAPLLGGSAEEACPPLRGQVLNHRLGKRCVLRVQRVDAPERTVVLRCLKAGDARHAASLSVMQQLWDKGFHDQADDDIRIPRPLMSSEALATLAIEDVPGELLGETGRWPLTGQAAVAGRVLAKLHGCPLGVARTRTVGDELTLLADWVAFTSELRPELQHDLGRALHSVWHRLGGLPQCPPALVHRDYYGKQLIHDGQTTTLIDFDTLCQADPALDLGNYLAHRRLAAHQGRPVADDEPQALLAAYAERARPVAPARLGAWLDAARLRLACLYALQTGQGHLAPGLLGEIQ